MPVALSSAHVAVPRGVGVGVALEIVASLHGISMKTGVSISTKSANFFSMSSATRSRASHSAPRGGSAPMRALVAEARGA
eukprot:3665916-Prymnesium_polylepis.1